MDKFIELSKKIVLNFNDGLIARHEVNSELLYCLAVNLDVKDKFYLNKIHDKYVFYSNKGINCTQKRHHIEWLLHYIFDLELINEFWQDKSKGDKS
jgi:hypothetical protein